MESFSVFTAPPPPERPSKAVPTYSPSTTPKLRFPCEKSFCYNFSRTPISLLTARRPAIRDVPDPIKPSTSSPFGPKICDMTPVKAPTRAPISEPSAPCQHFNSYKNCFSFEIRYCKCLQRKLYIFLFYISKSIFFLFKVSINLVRK